ncbi:MAG: N-dimethylarginine dimethylaminohydrolase [Planctomycetota bacterium]|jgi:N-dimethylarginine dimethylaminohydrolase
MNDAPKAQDYWGIDNDYGVLRDVLLGKPDFFKWVEAGPLIGRTLKNMHKTGFKFDFELSQRQHQDMVKIYEDAGVICHYLDSDPVLHRNFFARDSSAMTPWGALICHMQLKCRRADYVTTIKFYQDNNIPIWNYATAGHFEGGDFVILEPGTVLIGYCGERSEQEGSEQVAGFVRAEGWDVEVAPIPALFVHMDGLVVPLDEKLVVTCLDALEGWVIDWLKKKGFSFVDVDFGEAKDLGVNLVALGNKKVLSMAGSLRLNEKLRALGYQVLAPDMSMFTLGGGGVHCLCQALKRDSVTN